MDLLAGDVELTEFEAIDVQSIKGVGQGANGFPILMMKGLPGTPAAKAEPGALSAVDIAVKAVTGGTVTQDPDISLGHQIMALLAQAIENEAQEIGAGIYGETCDVDLLNCAASMISRWLGHEQSPGPDGDDGGMMLMQSAAKAVGWAGEQADLFAALLKDSREFSADERKKHAAAGNALPDGSYPIPDKDALRRAAILARSKHGDWKAAERLIARRAKELGVPNPLADKDDDTSKSQIAPEVPAVDTVTQETGGLTKAVEDAIAKATAPLQERIQVLDAELAKVKATPVPTGMVLSRNVQVKTPGGAVNDDLLAKAALYRQKAADATVPGDREGYLALARETEQAARTKSA